MHGAGPFDARRLLLLRWLQGRSAGGFRFGWRLPAQIALGLRLESSLAPWMAEAEFAALVDGLPAFRVIEVYGHSADRVLPRAGDPASNAVFLVSAHRVL